MKTCTKCKQEKPLSEYHLTYSKKNPEQRRADCRLCVNAARVKRESTNGGLERNRAELYKYRKADPVRFMLYDAKNRAKKQGVPFNIKPEELPLPTHCPVLGIPLILGEGKVLDNSPTLDKFIPKLGYVKGNVTIMSFKANTMKQKATTAEVQLLADWMKQQEENKDDINKRTTTEPTIRT